MICHLLEPKKFNSYNISIVQNTILYGPIVLIGSGLFHLKQKYFININKQYKEKMYAKVLIKNCSTFSEKACYWWHYQMAFLPLCTNFWNCFTPLPPSSPETPFNGSKLINTLIVDITTLMTISNTLRMLKIWYCHGLILASPF